MAAYQRRCLDGGKVWIVDVGQICWIYSHQYVLCSMNNLEKMGVW